MNERVCGNCVHCIACSSAGGAQAVCDCGHYRQPWDYGDTFSSQRGVTKATGCRDFKEHTAFHSGELKMIRRWFKEYERRLAHGVGD